MNKQTDFERVMAVSEKYGIGVTVTPDPMGKVVNWHEQSPRMVYDHAGKHIETRGRK